MHFNAKSPNSLIFTSVCNFLCMSKSIHAKLCIGRVLKKDGTTQRLTKQYGKAWVH